LYHSLHTLQTRQYQPSPSIRFVVTQPKAREIYAARFNDRVIHHVLIPQLEALYEPIFIHDVYSNRKGRGIHQAVQRLQCFMRQVVGADSYPRKRAPRIADRNPLLQAAQGRCDSVCGYAENSTAIAYPHSPACFLQLDIKSCFNNINRQTVCSLLKKRLLKAQRQGKISPEKQDFLRYLSWTLLRHNPAHNAIERSSTKAYGKVPPHKQLAHAAPYCGLPIGDLSSQFFANVYLNELDQFVKHTLKCRHYLRYVDDFVLLHNDPQQLLQWRGEIEGFLADNLGMQLKELALPKPVNQGADFLGYIIRPHYKLVRGRVVQHFKQRLRQFAKHSIQSWADGQYLLNAQPGALQNLRAVVASYLGHFAHAHSAKLLLSIRQQFPWLDILFAFSAEAMRATPRWQGKGFTHFAQQQDFFKGQFSSAAINIQCGYTERIFPAMPLRHPVLSQRHPALDVGSHYSMRDTVSYVRVQEHGYLKSGIKHRVANQFIFFIPEGVPHE